MLAGRLCFSQCELVVLPPRRHNMLFSIHSMGIVTVSHRIGGKGMAEERLPGRKVGQKDQGESTWHTLLQVRPLINYGLKIIIFLICFAHSGHISQCAACILVYLFIYFCVYRSSLPTPYGCRSNNVKHFALASFCNLQFPNVRPVESRSDNGHALPPVVFVPPYLPSINATAGVSCNNTCTSELSAWERERKGRQENRGGNRGRRLRLRKEEGEKNN